MAPPSWESRCNNSVPGIDEDRGGMGARASCHVSADWYDKIGPRPEGQESMFDNLQEFPVYS